MEEVLRKLEVPFLIIIALLVLLLVAKSTEVYNNYWQGKLAKKRFLSDNIE